MTKLNKTRRFLGRFKAEDAGTMAAMWGVSLSAIVFAVGSTFDYAKVSTARHKSQNAADMIALSAAAYIRDNGEKPTSDTEGFQHNVKYYLDDIGIDLEPYVDKEKREDGTLKHGTRPSFKVKYDTPSAGQLRVDVNGKTRPAFMQIAGVDMIKYSARSEVSYQASDLRDPASIFLVLDNSGSMGDTDDDNISRQDEMESTVKTFMDDLELLTAGVNTNVLRTGQFPYYSQFDYNFYVAPKWGTLTDAEIEQMYDGGGTNSHSGMDKARIDMAGENQAHQDEHGNGNPLKFVVFMTDGVNNPDGTDPNKCVPKAAHYHWKKTSGWGTGSISHSSYQPSWRWQQVWEPEGEWETCADTSTLDGLTLQDCTSMKNDGVKIYSIGYAMSAKPGDSQETIWERERAFAMLNSCASGPEYFFDADDAGQLSSAFDLIGEDIIEDTIRIRS